MTTRSSKEAQSLRVVSLFSGIAGGDLGLERAGHRVVEMCESWAPAQRVLQARFPNTPVFPDVRTYLPTVEYDLLSAGFPCNDLSHAGAQAGIFGPQSGLVEHVFRIAEATKPAWILLENVPNLLRLHKGAGIRFVVAELERLGYMWAYRVLDSRAFGVAQRRNRVIILASTVGNPASVLLSEDASGTSRQAAEGAASGFYWTEGRRGVGLVTDAIPTLKGGSTLGIPSAPAVWVPTEVLGRRIVLPSIEDAEVLQGLDRGWSQPADVDDEKSMRWKLVGNAITVGMAEWVGHRLADALEDLPNRPSSKLNVGSAWPDAAFGADGEVHSVSASRHPRAPSGPSLEATINHRAATPLSYRATRGFLSRVEESGISLPPAFMTDLEAHLQYMREAAGPKGPPVSWASSPAVRSRMQRTQSNNTTPEQRMRQSLSARGIRYRLQVRPIPDLRWRSDFVFAGAKLAVEVRGCFWHVCPVHQTWPKANAERWAEKLKRNQERDARMERELRERGWEVLVVWEHEDPQVAAVRVDEALTRRRPSRRSRDVVAG